MSEWTPPKPEVEVHIEGKWYGWKGTITISDVVVYAPVVYRARKLDTLEHKIDDFLLQKGIDW